MRYKFFLPLLFLSVGGWSATAFAHGTDIEYQKVQAIQIDAAYEGGQPMANSQVTVYAPNDPSTPWQKGKTNEKGQFTFVPDPSQPGNWEVKVRQAGHGDIITVPVGGTPTASVAGTEEVDESGNRLSWFDSEDSQDTLLQKALLAAAGAWGFFGTALFFARRRKTA